MNAFPIIFFISLIGCFVATYVTKPESDEVLMDFYKRVRPWGLWNPIRDKVLATDPNFNVNKDFWRDMFNVVIGTVWQTALMAIPVFIILRETTSIIVTLAVITVTMVILKISWWNKIED